MIFCPTHSPAWPITHTIHLTAVMMLFEMKVSGGLYGTAQWKSKETVVSRVLYGDMKAHP